MRHFAEADTVIDLDGNYLVLGILDLVVVHGHDDKHHGCTYPYVGEIHFPF